MWQRVGQKLVVLGSRTTLTVAVTAGGLCAANAAKQNFSTDELKKHTRDGDCWVSVDGNVYDVSDFLDQHPGGKHHLLENAGRDASKIFHHLHSDDVTHNTNSK